MSDKPQTYYEILEDFVNWRAERDGVKTAALLDQMTEKEQQEWYERVLLDRLVHRP